MKIIISITLYFILLTPGYAGNLKPFTTDGCSAFPNGTFEQKSLWVNCCISHDFAYWKGGTNAERLKADQQLERCVKKAGEPEIAKLMLTGVRMGGSPYFITPFRWGYGWPYARGYAALTDEEKLEVSEKLEMLKVMIESISRTLDENN